MQGKRKKQREEATSERLMNFGLVRVMWRTMPSTWLQLLSASLKDSYSMKREKTNAHVLKQAEQITLFEHVPMPLSRERK